LARWEAWTGHAAGLRARREPRDWREQREQPREIP